MTIPVSPESEGSEFESPKAPLLRAADVDRRAAVQFVTYLGDVTSGFNPLVPMGPNTIGEFLWPVSSEYDPETGRTRVGFSYMPPPRTCRACGCTDDRACVTPNARGAMTSCSWVEADLCSACVGQPVMA